jgi:hypothetical protein
VSDASASHRVVVGVDGSESSKVALRRAAAEAKAHGALLEIVHAWTYLDQPGPTFDPHYGEAKARERIDAFVVDVLGDDGPANTVLTVINDHASPAICACRRVRSWSSSEREGWADSSSCCWDQSATTSCTTPNARCSWCAEPDNRREERTTMTS